MKKSYKNIKYSKNIFKNQDYDNIIILLSEGFYE